MNAVSESPSSVRFARMGFNMGQMALNAADMYPGIFHVLLEIVQNALDEEAREIKVVVNYHRDFISVRDNGHGTTIERFNKALSTIATPGRKERGSLGQFGLGLISPLGKCRVATFTSCPDSGTQGYCSWVFDTEKIRREATDVLFPMKFRRDLAFSGKKEKSYQTEVDWRSEMRLEGIVPDQVTRRVELDPLVSEILSRFGTTMRRNNVRLSIEIVDQNGRENCRNNVTALDFQGRRLGVVLYTLGTVGQVKFDLYLAKQVPGGPQGKVSVGVTDDPFTFPFHFFARAAEIIRKDILDALKSGIFEGTIKGEDLKLHPNRQSFVKNDAFIDFCTAIEDWWVEHGDDHVQAAEKSMKDDRLQRLGLQSMDTLSSLLRESRYAPLFDAMRRFCRGTVGVGHTAPPKSSVAGKQSQHSLTPGSTPFSRGGKQGDRERREPANPKEGHHPLSVAGPQGQRRKIVRNDSLGLQFAHEQMEGSNQLWELDPRDGVLIFNIRHPLWVECDDKGDTHIVKLQEMIAIQALTLLTMPESQRAIQRLAFDELNNTMIPWSIRDRRK